MRARYAIAAMIIALAFVLGLRTEPRATEATPPGENGLIAFVEEKNEGSDIWVVNSAGGDPVNLTGNPPGTSELSPSWSSAGTRILFLRDQRFWIMNADGSEQAVIATPDNFPPAPGDARWSPDGCSIAFFDDPSRYRNIYVFDLGSSQFRLLRVEVALENALMLDWSPDGSQVVFPGNDNLMVVDADGSNLTELPGTKGGSDPSWSPDGESIAFVGYSVEFEKRMINVLSLDDGEVRPLVEAENTNRLTPAWSPDGAEIAYLQTIDGSAPASIHIVSVDGANERVLAVEKIVSSSDLEWQPIPTEPVPETCTIPLMTQATPQPTGAPAQGFPRRGGPVNPDGAGHPFPVPVLAAIGAVAITAAGAVIFRRRLSRC